MQHNIQEWQQGWNRQDPNWRQQRREWNRQRYNRRQKGDKVWFGAIVALLGVFLLLKKLGMFYFDWDILWPVALIAIGLLIGVKKRFHNHAWWILTLIGVAQLVPEFQILNTTSSHLVFPLALIIGGFMIALKSKKHKNWQDHMQVVTNDENSLNIDITFGGRKEIVTSKDFKGGNIKSTFGGCEVNMIQADSATQPMVLNMQVTFSGVELIVPSHWELQVEIEPTFGSVEDHRAMRTAAPNNEEKKLLILRGNCSFGSIEIKSY